MDKQTVKVSYPFVIEWSNLFRLQKLVLLKKMAEYKNIPLDELLHYLEPENVWEHTLPISRYSRDRCVARVYNEGYGGRCMNQVFENNEFSLCKTHNFQFKKKGKCEYGSVL